MKVLAKRIWEEPAVAIGLLTTLILVILNLIGDNEWGVDELIAILAPFASSIGIRQAVMPASKLDELTAPPEGTTYRKESH